MKKNSLLATLAQLIGDITIENNSNPDELLKLQQLVAATLINEPTLPASTSFQFEQLENFSIKDLSADELQHLNKVLQRVKEDPQALDPGVKIFRRETPVISSQVRRSLPGWARGAKITDSIGPVITNDGRKVWFDLYRTIPLVQVWMQGAAQPFMLLPLQVGNLRGNARPKDYKIPAGSAWIQADKLAADAPDNLYCGLTLGGGELTLTRPVSVTTDNKLIIPNGVEAAFSFDLDQKEVTEVSPDNNGIDAKEAKIELPKTLTYTINQTGSSLQVASASWDLYGHSIHFTYDHTRPAIWNTELNRINIFFNADVSDFNAGKCKSDVCKVSGKAAIMNAAWALSAAAINTNAPLQADGTGAMLVVVKEGLVVSWLGLKDASLYEASAASLRAALVMLMPGRINISSPVASNPTGKQRYNLWQEEVTDGIEKPVQHIDLLYTHKFSFLYDSLQKGTESVAVQTNCICNVNKPVQVSGAPFKVESLQTFFTLSISKALQVAFLYDDNIIQDNWSKAAKPKPGTAPPLITFDTTAVALNNALLTVSPVNSILLWGDLKDEDSFDKCVLIYGFGLLQYLPSLPDPYAANVSMLRRGTRGAFSMRGMTGNETAEQAQPALADINAMLVCFMKWNNLDAPEVNFFFGDKPPTQQQATITRRHATPQAEPIGISTLHQQERLQQVQQLNTEKAKDLQHRKWQAVTGNNELVAALLGNEHEAMLAANRQIAEGQTSPFQNAFTLLDVSTNADLMGVSLGFASERLVLERTQVAQEEISGNSISIAGMDVYATSRLVQIYSLPQISWEPVINLSGVTNPATDPYPGILFFLNDGVPAQIANTGNEPVNLAPLPLTRQITEWYEQKDNFAAWSYFTLPYGMLALAMYIKNAGKTPKLELIEKNFSGELQTGLQIKTEGFYEEKNKHRKFLGSAHQLTNAYNLWFPATGARSILSGSVTSIYNNEFGTSSGFETTKVVPLERYDFSGYGANVFSHWVNPNAAIAQTSQAMFDVWRGRTAHEVVQVKSILYPWGIRVVRTITIYRSSTGFEWRIDSGWKAESDGIYDFRTAIEDDTALQSAINQEKARTYKFHPGMVDGVYNVRNIKEDITLAPFEIPNWNKTTGVWINDKGLPEAVPAGGIELPVKLVPVYFDADVSIDDVTQGATDGKVLSQRMLGYLQLSPRGVFIDEEHFAQLLSTMNGLGGPVDCMVNINQSRQPMRVTRVEVNPGRDSGNNRVFVTAAKGTPVLPNDGSWSVVQHDRASKEVTPLTGNNVVPLVREGLRTFTTPDALDYAQEKLKAVNIAEATELFTALESRAKQYAFLQSTGENKVLFRNPLFEKGVDTLKGSVPDLADAYRLMNSKGIFPKVENLPKLDEIGEAANKFAVKIVEEGYQLVNNTLANAEQKLVQLLPEGPWYIVKTNDVKVYVEYKPTKADGSTPPGSPSKAKLDFDLDSKKNEWVNRMNDVTMVVDLGPFKRLLLIRGKFNTKKGEPPSFVGPELEFGPDLQPVVDILVLLSQLAVSPDYKSILQRGLKVAMSNSPNNWEYKFQADKEIPVLKFPAPGSITDTAAAPLRLEAGLKVGVFFNLALAMPPGSGTPALGAGAFVEFYGKLSVICVSVGVGSIYAVGQVTVRLSAHTVTGPALYMKFGFGVEAVVALPVIGSVSVYFAAGVEMSLSSTELTIAAFILFRGRADILGGIVTIQIMIEASGKMQKRIGGDTGQTNMIAQVTFSLDISICFVIDISFTEKWSEQRQIA